MPRPFRMLARTPGGAMTCDGRTDQNVPSPRGVHPIETRASWRVFPRTLAAKANKPGYASSEHQDPAGRRDPGERTGPARKPPRRRAPRLRQLTRTRS